MTGWGAVSQRGRYAIAIGLVMVGVLGAVGWLQLSLGRVSDDVNRFQRVPLPGQATLRLAAHKYVIYYEAGGTDRPLAGFNLAVLDARTGAIVDTPSYGGSLTYDFDRKGSALATVTPPHAGTYTVSASARTRTHGARLALGRSIAGDIVGTVLGTLAIGGLVVGSGTVLLVIMTARRRRDRRSASGSAVIRGAD